jgi:hypothetical protein
MTGAWARAASLVFLGTVIPAWAADPLVGMWRLSSQEVAGQATDADPLTLRIIQSGNHLEFAYSVPVNNIQFVSMRFTTRLDGTEGEVKNAQGTKIGTVKISKADASEYKVTLQGENRPTASSKMKISPDGKKLTCESDSKGRQQETVHTIQVFLRQ